MACVVGFGFIWITELISAIFHYSLIVGVCTWYFTSTNEERGTFSLCTGLWWAFRYNMGSLAFGSFILAVIWVLRIIFEYFAQKIEKMNQDNPAVKCILCACRCCLECCHKFVKFINQNAYVQMALTGHNFCSSAMSGFALAIKHSVSFIITNGIGYFLNILGKLAIACANTGVGYLILTKVPKY